jgi:hypothetical protein
VRDINNIENFRIGTLVSSSIGNSINFFFISVAAYAGNATTRAAEDSVDFFESLLRSHDFPTIDTIKNISMMSQIRSRNLKVRSSFFDIDWKMLMTVRFEWMKFDCVISSFFQIISTVVTYLVIATQFDH